MLLLPAILQRYGSKTDKTFTVVFASQEITPEQVAALNESLQQFGYLAFKVDKFKQKEIEVIDNLKSDYEDTGKTPGQRLRGVLYRLWEKDAEGFKNPVDHYNSKMETLIQHFKTKLD
jgi:hypothetical protein